MVTATATITGISNSIVKEMTVILRITYTIMNRNINSLFDITIYQILLSVLADVDASDGCRGSSSVSLAITVHSPYPLSVYAHTPKI